MNADFYPASDRKHLLFEGFQGEWNRAAIQSAADVLAGSMQELRTVLSAENLWQLIVEAHACREEEPDRRSGIASFWQAIDLELEFADLAIMWTSAGSWVPPRAAVITKTPDEEIAIPLLEDLGLDVVHPTLRQFVLRLPWATKLGVSEFALDHVVRALHDLGLTEALPPERLPKGLASSDRFALLW